MESADRQHHFILVHGICHGAWCWYRVTTILESSGHRVTVLDMAGCGARPQRTEEVASFEEYSGPLLDVVAALPPGERAILVGHSFGGRSLALAMERYPEKVAVAVFVSAAMPAAGKPMTIIYEQVRLRVGLYTGILSGFIPQNHDFLWTNVLYSLRKKGGQITSWTARTEPAVSPESSGNISARTTVLGSEIVSAKSTLATALVRPARRFQNDALMKENVLTAERYGAAKRVYIVAEDDALWPAEFQRRMAASSPGTEVKELRAADHMPMFSKPRELSELLMEIAEHELRNIPCSWGLLIT